MVSRSAESESVAEFLSSAQRQPSGLVIEGEAGIGKTTLWLATLDQAREHGFRVLSARAWEAESVLAYGTLADLLSDVEPDELAGLADVQRVAVDRVLLRDTGGGPATDQRVVAAALVSIIGALAQAAPVLIGIDDLQWLDASSRGVVAYTARRLKGRAGLLATERTDHNATTSWLQLANPVGFQRIRVGPMSLGELRTMISERLGRTLSRPTMARIADVSAGNPFYALEMARTVGVQPSIATQGLPQTLAELMRIRMGDLDDGVLDLLLAASCVADPTVDLLARATHTTAERVIGLLEEVESRGMVGIEGNRVRFSHPLLARGVYTDVSPARRRAAHRALAGVVEQPELRARHLAMSAASADPEVLQALDEAADAARARGAPAAAAELLDLAIGLGGDTPLRRIRAADHRFQAGDADQAAACLLPALEQPPGPLRTVAMTLRARMQIHDNKLVEAADLLKSVLDDAQQVSGLRIRVLLLLSHAQRAAGQFDEALSVARQAISAAEAHRRPALISQTLAVWVHTNFESGNGVDEASLARALELEDCDTDVPILFRASLIDALMRAFTGRLHDAHNKMLALRRRCDERGAEGDLMAIAGFSCLINIWLGHFTEAAGYAEEAVERARHIDGDHVLVIPLSVRAAAASYLGRAHETRADARAAIDAARSCGSAPMAVLPTVSLGFLEASQGNYAEALTILQPLLAAPRPCTEILSASFIPETIEAMVAMGRLDEADPLIEEFERNGRRLDRAWMLAVGARCRSMTLAARGDIEAAVETAYQAMTEHDRLPMPFERARTQLLLGQLQRRQRQKQAAAATLSEALSAFETMGTPLWAERAHAELARTNVSPRNYVRLTPSEQRVAELAASGMTNRGVAAKLFISVKTVEANLTQIYRKLGIHSRAELGNLMGQEAAAR